MLVALMRGIEIFDFEFLPNLDLCDIFYWFLVLFLEYEFDKVGLIRR